MLLRRFGPWCRADGTSLAMAVIAVSVLLKVVTAPGMHLSSHEFPFKFRSG